MVSRTYIPLLLLTGFILPAACLSCHPAQRDTQPPELRGVWLTNVDSHVLESRAQIAGAMTFLQEHNFNAVFPVVWNKGVTLYPSPTMDRLFGIPIDTAYRGRDPLAEIVAEAHARGIAVIPWFEFGFSSSMNRKGGHILQQKPEWGERDRDGRLLSKNGFEWMNAWHPEVQSFLLALILEVVNGYEIDGIQGDDRLPAQPVEGGYSEYTQSLYAHEHGGTRPPRDFRDTGWVRWRAEKLTAFARRVHQAVKSQKPGLLVSWAPSIFPWSRDEYLQDWPAWVRAGAADLVIPQVYRYSVAQYVSALDSQAPDSLNLGPSPCLVVPGILMKVGPYVIPADSLLQVVAANRKRGYHGEVFFFYEGLRANNDTLATILRETFYRLPAELPFTLYSPFTNR